MAITSAADYEEYPPECVVLMQQMYSACARGCIAECMEIQRELMQCEMRYNLPVHEFSEEYFQLHYQLTQEAMSGELEPNSERSRAIAARLEQLMREAGFNLDLSPEAIAARTPAGYTELVSQYEQAAERGDAAEIERLSPELEAMHKKMGIINLVNIIK